MVGKDVKERLTQEERELHFKDQQVTNVIVQA